VLKNGKKTKDYSFIKAIQLDNPDDHPLELVIHLVER
jgi:hypothetical protein